MSRTATANSLASSGTGRRLESWADQMAHLQTMQGEVATALQELANQRAATADDMARALMPVAEAMAKLTEETRQTMTRIVSQSQKGHQAALEAMSQSTAAAKDVANDLRTRLIQTQDQVEQLRTAARSVEERQPTSPWGPAMLAALVPTAAVLWLAWKVGAMH